MEVEVVVRVLRVVGGDGMRRVKATTRDESIGSATVRLMVSRDAVYAPACTMPCCVGEGKRRSHPAATVSIGLSTVVDSVAACPFLQAAHKERERVGKAAVREWHCGADEQCV